MQKTIAQIPKSFYEFFVFKWRLMENLGFLEPPFKAVLSFLGVFLIERFFTDDEESSQSESLSSSLSQQLFPLLLCWSSLTSEKPGPIIKPGTFMKGSSIGLMKGVCGMEVSPLSELPLSKRLET